MGGKINIFRTSKKKNEKKMKLFNINNLFFFSFFKKKMTEIKSKIHYDEGVYAQGHIKWSAAWSQGLRDKMEDRYCCHEFYVKTHDHKKFHYVFFLVMDGHGGTSVANMCRNEFPGLLYHHLKQFHQDQKIETSELYDVIHQTFESMTEKLMEQKEKVYGIGSTLSLTLLQIPYMEDQILNMDAKQIYVANVGDSAVMGLNTWKRSSSQFAKLTIDDRLDNLDEQERIETVNKLSGSTFFMNLQDGYLYKNNGNGLQLSRSMGDFGFSPAVISKPHIYKLPKKELKSYHFILMASDGLYDYVPDLNVVKPFFPHAKDILKKRQEFPELDNTMIVVIEL